MHSSLAFRHRGFNGFEGTDQGDFVATSVAHAAWKIIEDGKRLSVAVNALAFMFSDEIPDRNATLNIMTVAKPHSRLMDFISKFTDVGQPDPEDNRLVQMFCKEFTATDDIDKVGQEVTVYFYLYADPILVVGFPREPKEKVMHDASQRLMEAALQHYDASGSDASVNLLDVGSYDINGTFRPMITGRGWLYTGLDIVPGDNVDILTENPYHYPIKTGTFDVVISGSVAYAVLDLVSWTKEVARVLRPGGLLAIVTPSLAKPATTQSPVDLWRMTEDALRMLLENTGVLSEIQVVTSHHDVCASAIRMHGEIDERQVSPAVEHKFEVAGGTAVSGSATKSVSVAPRKSKKPVARKAVKGK